MSYYYNRDFALLVGVTLITTRPPGLDTQQPMLRTSFRVERSTASEPNKAEVRIWNLSKTKRAAFQKKLPVILEAGYVNSREQIFAGEITRVDNQREDVDWVTVIEASDGKSAYAGARINTSIEGPTPFAAVLAALGTALSAGGGGTSIPLGPGNSIAQFGSGVFRGGQTVFGTGVVLSGRVSDLLDQYCTSAGLTWSIQDNQLQILRPGTTTTELAVALSSKTGLIGSPEVGEKGEVRARSLMNPGIRPGRRVLLLAEQVKGSYRVDRVTHTGDTFAKEWYSESEGKPVI